MQCGVPIVAYVIHAQIHIIGIKKKNWYVRLMKKTKRKVHLDMDFDEYKMIACFYNQWMNSGVPMPNWKTTVDENEVTCKRCLGMIRTDLLSID